MRVIPVGPDATLVELAPGEGPAAILAAWARERLLAREIVPAATTVLLDGVPAAVAGPALADFRSGADLPAGPEVVVPVAFDGPDLADVASAVGLAADQVTELLLAAEYVVAFSGFAPGFGYLTGLPPVLHLPRRATPRTRVPAGSFAIAGEYAGIYPTASPGGWHLIGSTDEVLWDPAREEPALLAPGARVRITAR
jgi:allophanate hydrolase subunit 1